MHLATEASRSCRRADTPIHRVLRRASLRNELLDVSDAADLLAIEGRHSAPGRQDWRGWPCVTCPPDGQSAFRPRWGQVAIRSQTPLEPDQLGDPYSTPPAPIRDKSP